MPSDVVEMNEVLSNVREGEHEIIDDITGNKMVFNGVLVLEGFIVCPVFRNSNLDLRRLYLGEDDIVHMTVLSIGKLNVREYDDLNDAIKNYNEEVNKMPSDWNLLRITYGQEF